MSDLPPAPIMKTRRALALCASMCAIAPAFGQNGKSGQSHGELLYSTYCVGCHTTQVHWRDKTLAKDWTSLKAQVLRWQRNVGLGWSDDDVAAVARYLNDLYYRFPATDTKQSASRHDDRSLAVSVLEHPDVQRAGSVPRT